MTVYRDRGKWRYDFYLKRKRYRKRGFPKKSEAIRAEAEIRKELETPSPKTPADMVFLDLCNEYLDYSQLHHSESWYQDKLYIIRKQFSQWFDQHISEIHPKEIELLITKRAKDISNCTANSDLKILNAIFNYGLKKGLISANPASAIEKLPVGHKTKYIPPKEDVVSVIMLAKPIDKAFLLIIKNTLARVGEILKLTWNDVNMEERWLVLKTRKKRGGIETPRKIHMNDELYQTILWLYNNRDKRIEWIFHKNGQKFKRRPKMLITLCRRLAIREFGYHAIRHYGASILDHKRAPLTDIRDILGHADISTTQIYLQSISESQKKTMELLMDDEKGGGESGGDFFRKIN